MSGGTTSFADLPDECHIEIARHLDDISLCSVMRTSRALRLLSQNDLLWQMKLAKAGVSISSDSSSLRQIYIDSVRSYKWDTMRNSESHYEVIDNTLTKFEGTWVNNRLLPALRDTVCRVHFVMASLSGSETSEHYLAIGIGAEVPPTSHAIGYHNRSLCWMMCCGICNRREMHFLGTQDHGRDVSTPRLGLVPAHARMRVPTLNASTLEFDTRTGLLRCYSDGVCVAAAVVVSGFDSQTPLYFMACGSASTDVVTVLSPSDPRVREAFGH